MPGKVELAGRRFGRWTVITQGHRDSNGAIHWSCRCDCGTTRSVRGSILTQGKSKSCGCAPNPGKRTHGETRTPLYKRWLAMVGRCTLPNWEGYPQYGGRGISVCERWRSYEAFKEDMGASFEPHLSLDRIDVNGDYEPGNCRWATASEQARNTTRNHILAWQERSQTIADWADELGLNRITIAVRLHRGWSIERALSTPAEPDVSQVRAELAAAYRAGTSIRSLASQRRMARATVRRYLVREGVRIRADSQPPAGAS